mgnify:CR=1 FL=1
MSRALAAWDGDATALSGGTEISKLTVAGQPITVTGEPNQVVPLINGRLVINEQFNSETEVTVNALHLVINGVADVVLEPGQGLVMHGETLWIVDDVHRDGAVRGVAVRIGRPVGEAVCTGESGGRRVGEGTVLLNCQRPVGWTGLDGSLQRL